jgi:membrane protein implicated in regulation of membrane protease activity
VLLGLVLALILVLAAFYVAWGWTAGYVSIHGLIAYALGGFLTLALSAGLFLLSFYSSRSGRDEQADQASRLSDDPFRPRD